MASPAPVELCSWKEIASYLGVSVKTAQVWEETRGLPVRRLPGPRVQVRALVSELELWKTGSEPVIAQDVRPADEPELPLTVSIAEARRSTVGWWPFAVLLTVLLTGGWYWWSRPVLDSVRVESDALLGLDAGGVVLWRVPFGVLEVSRYAHQVSRPWLGEIGGRRVVLFIPFPVGTFSQSVPLVCLDTSGKILWRFVPGRRVTKGTNAFNDLYAATQFQVLNDKVVVSSFQYPYYPSQVAVLDKNGGLLREYWHPGHLYVIAAGTYRGKSVAYVGGINNDRHAATMIVLDPERLDGATVEKGRPFLDGFSPGVEEARLLFPRSCLSKKYPYNAIYSIIPSQHEIIVDVHEELDVPHPASIQYHLNTDLTLKEAAISDIFQTHHTGHEYTTQEQEALRNITFVR